MQESRNEDRQQSLQWRRQEHEEQAHDGQAPGAGGRPNKFQTLTDVVVDRGGLEARGWGSTRNAHHQGDQEREERAGIEREGAGNAEDPDECGRQHGAAEPGDIELDRVERQGAIQFGPRHEAGHNR